MAASPAQHFAIDASKVLPRIPASTWRAAWCTIRRAACTCIAMSASMNWMPWNAAIGWPNCCRSFAYAAAASSAAWPMPTAIAPVIGRVMSRVRIAILNPSPSSPSRCSIGTAQSVKWSATVGEQRQVLLLLLLGAGEEDREPAQRVRAEIRGRPRARPAELLGDQRQRQAAHVRAAELLWHPDAEEAGVDERPHRLGRIALGLVVLRGIRRDPVARDFPREIADHPLLLGEIEEVVHIGVSLRRSVAAGAPRAARAPGRALQCRSSHCARRDGAES